MPLSASEIAEALRAHDLLEASVRRDELTTKHTKKKIFVTFVVPVV